jgi:hypothetical protein
VGLVAAGGRVMRPQRAGGIPITAFSGRRPGAGIFPGRARRNTLEPVLLRGERLVILHGRLRRAVGCGWAAIACLTGAGALGAGPPPFAVAVVTDLAGAGRLERESPGRRLAVLDTLQSGDRIGLLAGASAEIAFTAGSGSVLRLRGPGRFRIGEHGVQLIGAGASVERRDLAAAWRNVQIRTGLVGRASIALRGLAATQVRLREPIGGLAGAEPVRLQWDPPYGGHAGPWDYTVRLIDDQGKLLYEERAGDQSLVLPADLRLERNRDYLWTVQARDAQRRHAYGAAEFHRVAPEVEQRIDGLRQAVLAARRDPAQAESSAEEVLLAVAMDQAGLRNAAQRQLRELLPLRPALAPVLALQP